MNIKHTALLLLTGLFSCKQQVAEQSTVDTLSGQSPAKADTIANQKLAINPDSVLKPFPGITYNTSYTYNTAVILTGDFHGDEVPDNAARLKWSGVFKSDSGYYIVPTNIKVSVVKDEILDDDGNKTGKRVETANKDTAVILVSGKILKTGKVNKVPVKSLVFPGEKQVFTFKGSTYTLSATGQKISEKNSELYMLTNYRLFLSGIKDGRQISNCCSPNRDLIVKTLK
ncbi:hypothetical protein EOD41_00210 [Mucilaginibacter limnophilus]|uniref:Uncharacterized protein n=1 Tax=Mucilaginibacter limnophilus TaxID=1932778 RepID=A0A3S2VPL8_9SPHI|nr:hypothetical protein [Mucilaginibacter limnophilus]RVU02400.1 hypothetical protein EOD41_00210 [Mucilaginibacter limnophilus]